MAKVTIEIEDNKLEKLKSVLEMFDKEVETFLNESVDKYVQSYSEYNKEFTKTPALIKEPMGEKWEPCWFLYKTTVFGKPYATVVQDGKMIKTPLENVKLQNS